MTQSIFLENYIKVISLDDGIVPFIPYPFQRKLVDSFHNNRFSICSSHSCQSGKSVTVTAYLIHQAIFRDNINIAIWATSTETSFEAMASFKLYENLPKWAFQQKFSWNKGSIELESRSRALRVPHAG